MLHSPTHSWTFNSEKEGPEDGLAMACATTWMAKLRLLFCPLPPSLIPSVPPKKRVSFQEKMGHYVLLNILRIISSHGTWQLRKYSNNLYFGNNLGLLLTSRNADMICFSWYICFLCVSVNLCEVSSRKYNFYFYQNVKLSNYHLAIFNRRSKNSKVSAVT